ncbi:MAG: peptidoglycan DD-metalloendopeptidase family protein [Halanaerobiales bacterium]|nr:peptidoglycan DD-metalloendopeptidase family protein [Halanaerobiales bacterium]
MNKKLLITGLILFILFSISAYNLISSSSEEPERLLDNRPPNVASLRDSLLEQVREHRVKQGESLWEIAQQYELDIDTIIGANDITNINQIQPGEVLKILPVKGIIYKIGPGESLWTISRQFAIRLDRLITANAIRNPNLVQPGMLLVLPGAKPEFGYQQRIEQKFISPVAGRISSFYGMRWGRMHEGIDYAVSIGTPIKAARSGKVIYSGWASGYGKTIVIEHQKGLRTLYGHNSELLVYGGQWVEQGRTIALSGNTGRSTGPHLHFEIQINGKAVDPLIYLK